MAGFGRLARAVADADQLAARLAKQATPLALDDLIMRLGKVDPAQPRMHSGVLFDSRKGIGGVPDGANIDYRGFQAYLTPRQFLDLNPPRVSGITHINEALQAGQPIGTPMLYVDRTPEGWLVRGHEGRGRMTAMQERVPDALFPVGVHPYGEIRARHLTEEDVFRRLLPDKRGLMDTQPRMGVLQQQPYVQPGYESDERVLQAMRELLQ